MVVGQGGAVLKLIVAEGNCPWWLITSGCSPRRIVVTIPTYVTDLVGNPLADAGARSFVPEVIAFSPVTLPPGSFSAGTGSPVIMDSSTAL